MAGRPGKLIERAEAVADKPEALVLLAGVSVAESAILPLPVDAVSMPIMALSRRRIPMVVLVATLSSIVGGVIGYAIGAFFFQFIGEPILGWLNQTEAYEAVKARMSGDWTNGAWIILIGAITPIPFKFVCWGAGALAFPFWIFLLLGVGGRFLRFAAFGILFWFFGPAFLSFLKRYTLATTIGMVVLIVLGFVAIPYIFPKA